MKIGCNTEDFTVDHRNAVMMETDRQNNGWNVLKKSCVTAAEEELLREKSKGKRQELRRKREQCGEKSLNSVLTFLTLSRFRLLRITLD